MEDDLKKQSLDYLPTHAEAISTLKIQVEKNTNKLDTLCPKGLFYWVVGFVISLCAVAFGSLFVIQSRVQTEIATMSSNVAHLIKTIDNSDFVSKREMRLEVKDIVRQELYLLERKKYNERKETNY